MDDTQLLSDILELDEEMIKKGLSLRKRINEIEKQMMKRLGYGSWSFGSNGYKRIQEAFATIYGSERLRERRPSGSFLYRDVFATIYVPIVFGTVRIEPFEFIDLEEKQKSICFADNEVADWYLDQFFDLCDVDAARSRVWGSKNNSLDYAFMSEALAQLTGAGAVVNSTDQTKAAIQAAILSMELCLKSAHAKLGKSETDIRKLYGHNLLSSLEGLESGFPRLDYPRLYRVAANSPDYVKSRYPGFEISNLASGHLIMGAQFFVSELVRALFGTSSRNNLRGQIPNRSYPPLQ